MKQNTPPVLPRMPRPATETKNMADLCLTASNADGRGARTARAYFTPKVSYRAIKFIGPWIVPLLAIAAWGLVLWLPLKVVGVV